MQKFVISMKMPLEHFATHVLSLSMYGLATGQLVRHYFRSDTSVDVQLGMHIIVEFVSLMTILLYAMHDEVSAKQTLVSNTYISGEQIETHY